MCERHGFTPYRSAISNTLSDRCDFAMLIKVYKAAVTTKRGTRLRMSHDVIPYGPKTDSTENVVLFSRLSLT